MFCRRIRKFLFKYAKIFTFWFLSAYISIIFTRNYSLFLNIFPYLWSHVPERFFFFVLFSVCSCGFAWRIHFHLFSSLSRLLSQFYSLCFVYFDNAWDVVMPQFRYFCGIEIKMSSEDLIFYTFFSLGVISIRNLNLHNRNITVLVLGITILYFFHFFCFWQYAELF